jgi:hypothetical protein
MSSFGGLESSPSLQEYSIAYMWLITGACDKGVRAGGGWGDRSLHSQKELFFTFFR